MDHTILAEQSVLGTMVEDNNWITDSQLTAEHFAHATHQCIFRTMLMLRKQHKPVDVITLLAAANPNELGGANYIANLSHYANDEKFEEYVSIIVEAWREKRKQQILQDAHMHHWALPHIIQQLDALQDGVIANAATIHDDLAVIYERPFVPPAIKTAVPTGLRAMDALLDGFQLGELTIIAARPSMGKTDIMNHFALAAGWAGYMPIIFSLEMCKARIIERMIASIANYNRTKMRNPYALLTDHQKDAWAPALGKLGQANIRIDDRAQLTVSQITARARQIMRDCPHYQPIIFIDYLQIMKPEHKQYESQTHAIGQISASLKKMAKDLACPVVCLSQLNRAVEARQNKRPLMSDLRDSGNIEQDADVIAFLYRDDYYNPQPAQENTLDIIVTKHRNGPTGQVTVQYVKETGRIKDLPY